MKKKTVILLLAAVLVFGIAAGATIAFLTDTTGEVKNTFVAGKVDIDLYEHPLLIENGTTDGKTIDTNADPVTSVTDYKMIPGNVLQKDPTVEVLDGSEPCWVIVQVTEANNTLTSDASGKYINWTIASGWTLVDGETNVYIYDTTVSAGAKLHILANDTVTVNQNATSADMTAAETDKPTLTFKAYAVQAENISKADAWAQFH
ncbi:MAG: hypothetical protein II185_01925 [Firmicutes bacterium]|nr:hypothetical protein [Bacillota bacterium]MBQ2311294.1 hypothetical protein [Bacillota bacterium]MBQ3930795.1 hypothetical protein [Bacillota bacterium]